VRDHGRSAGVVLDEQARAGRVADLAAGALADRLDRRADIERGRVSTITAALAPTAALGLAAANPAGDAAASVFRRRGLQASGRMVEQLRGPVAAGPGRVHDRSVGVDGPRAARRGVGRLAARRARVRITRADLVGCPTSTTAGVRLGPGHAPGDRADDVSGPLLLALGGRLLRPVRGRAPPARASSAPARVLTGPRARGLPGPSRPGRPILCRPGAPLLCFAPSAWRNFRS